jgi:hypothetical protein
MAPDPMAHDPVAPRLLAGVGAACGQAPDADAS